MVRKIVNSKEPKLREIAKPVSQIDQKVKGIIKDLVDTLKVQKSPEGVGLAAPQIGKGLRIFVVNYRNFSRVVINPEIISMKREPHSAHSTSLRALRGKNEILEGCLSSPNYYGPIRRTGVIKLKYLNENGQETVEAFSGFHAQIILHEIDHLNGILFVDRLLEQKKPLYKVEGENWEEVDL